jgi:thiamine transporter
MGVIQMLFGIGNFSYVSGIVSYLILAFADYIIAFGALGLGGMFKKKIANPVIALALGGGVVSVIRFICHFVSGVTIWGDYAQGAQAVWEYSFTYNAGYMVPEMIATSIAMLILLKNRAAKSLIRQ